MLIVIDTLRRDHVSAYGGSVSTPHIDSLAARGQLFENALSSYFQTTMSMASLFTGRTPSLETRQDATLPWNGRVWCGLARFAEAGEQRCVPEGVPTLAQAMRGAGYWTIGVASNDFLFEPAGFARGFDDWSELRSRLPPDHPLAGSAFGPQVEERHAARHVLDRVSRALARRRGDRFFLYVHFMEVHDHKPYAEGVEAADRAVGSLLELLEKEGLLEGAVVVLTADHGERLGEQSVVTGFPRHQGNPAFDPLLRVPLIVAPPVDVDTRQVLRSDDVFRLLLRIAGVESPAAADLERGELFVSEREYRTYRKGRWKSFTERGTGATLLVDLEADPGERRDASAEHPEVIREHRTRMAELTRSLAADRARIGSLTEDDRLRLRALGYLDDEPDEAGLTPR